MSRVMYGDQDTVNKKEKKKYNCFFARQFGLQKFQTGTWYVFYFIRKDFFFSFEV